MATPRDLAQKMAAKSDQELLAMFASPDDWTTEALDSAKAELQKRGLDSTQEPPPLEPEWGPSDSVDFLPAFGRAQTADRDDRPDVYEYFGLYSNADARLLLDAFVSGDIEYTLNADKMGLGNMSAFQAANGVTFGIGVGIAIGVHADDCDRAMEIRQRVLKIRS